MTVKSQHKITHQQADGAVYVPFEKEFTAKVADMDVSGIVNFPIEAGQRIYGISALVVTPVSGGTPALQIGDSDDANGYLEDGNMDETSDNAFWASFGLDGASGSNAYAHGKYYPTTNILKVTFNSDATAGEIEILARMAGKEAVV